MVTLVQSKVSTAAASATSISATFDSAPTSGNIIWVAAGLDKEAGTITGPSGFTQIANDPATSLGIWFGYKVSAGTETTITVSRSTASVSGDGMWIAEYSETDTGEWVIQGSAVHYTDESAVKVWSSGTTGTLTGPGRALACFVLDTATNAASESWSNSYVELKEWTVTGGGADVAIAYLDVSSGTAETTHTHVGTADQISGCIAVFGRRVNASISASAVASPASAPSVSVSTPSDSPTPSAVAATVAAPAASVSASSSAFFTETFTLSDGSGWGANWTQSASSTGASATVQSGQGEQDAGTDVWGKRADRYDVSLTDAEFVGTFTYQDATGQTEVWIRGQSDASGSDGYFVKLARSGVVQVFAGAGGTYPQIGSDVSFSISTGTAYRMRFRVVGTSIKFRIWANADSEPGTWQIDQTATYHSSGYFYLQHANTGTASSAIRWDNITLSDGNTSIAASVSASATALPATIPSPAPSVGVTLAVAAPIATTVTAPGAALATGAGLSPSQVPSNATVATPGISSGLSLSGVAIAAISALPLASVSGTALASPAPTLAASAVPLHSVSTGSSASVTATAVSIPVSVNAASLSAGTLATPAAIHPLTSTPALAVSTGAGVAPSAAGIVLHISAPGVSTGSSANISADPVSSVASVPLSGLSVGVNIAPGPIAAMAESPESVIAVGVSLTLTPVTVTAIAPVVTVTGSAGVIASPVAATGAIHAVSPGTGLAVNPAPVIAGTVISLPTLSAGHVITPSVLALSVAAPSASAGAGAGLSGVPVACTVVLPLGQLGTGARAAPDVVRAALAVPAVIIAAGDGAIVYPDTLALSATVAPGAVSSGTEVNPSVLAAAGMILAPRVRVPSRGNAYIVLGAGANSRIIEVPTQVATARIVEA